MSYTNEDIFAKAALLTGGGLSAESEKVLSAVCGAAAAELEAKLKRGGSADALGETFVTAAGMLALALCMELENSAGAEISSFKAGSISASLREGGVKASAATLRKAAEDMLSSYLDRGGFCFTGVAG